MLHVISGDEPLCRDAKFKDQLPVFAINVKVVFPRLFLSFGVSYQSAKCPQIFRCLLIIEATFYACLRVDSE